MHAPLTKHTPARQNSVYEFDYYTTKVVGLLPPPPLKTRVYHDDDHHHLDGELVVGFVVFESHPHGNGTGELRLRPVTASGVVSGRYTLEP